MNCFANIDFETYSESGYRLIVNRWKSLSKSPPHGLNYVGAAKYAEHPSTEILSLAYHIDGDEEKLWLPKMQPPTDLFQFIVNRGTVKAWNSIFEYLIWNKIAVPQLNWPALPITQTLDTMARARVFALPGKLAKAAEAIAFNRKMGEGKNLIKKFSVPRNPTKKDKRLRILPEQETLSALNFYAYNLADVRVEREIDSLIPEFSDFEKNIWLLDQKINIRGVKIDLEAVKNSSKLVKDATARYTEELLDLTNGTVKSVDELKNMKIFLAQEGYEFDSLKADVINQKIESVSGKAKRVLEIRKTLSSASVKKLKTIKNRLCEDGRLRGLYNYYGASRTGRFSGGSVQPQNLKSEGPPVKKCVNCNKHFTRKLQKCPFCDGSNSKNVDWGIDAIKDALDLISDRNLDRLTQVFDQPLDTIGGCLRGLFCADLGKELISSDFSSIEAVVLSMLSGEEWRIEVFRTHGKIYEMSASKITGVPFEEFINYKKTHGVHHPLRKKIGKPAELGSGFGGGYKAWCDFGADEHLMDQEIIDGIKVWRSSSPKVVRFWKDLEYAAINAILDINTIKTVGLISYKYNGKVLLCRLPSSRILYYHNPRVYKKLTPWGKEVLAWKYEGWNSNFKRGPTGWMEIETWGGTQAENVTQATARDIFCFSMLNVEKHQYLPVLHTHDEITSEIDKGFGSVEHFELVMTALDTWCSDWPIKVSGGWRGFRYRK